MDQLKDDRNEQLKLLDRLYSELEVRAWVCVYACAAATAYVCVWVGLTLKLLDCFYSENCTYDCVVGVDACVRASRDLCLS